MLITKIEDRRLEENLIPGVEFKQLKSHPDDRGFFREIVRATDPFFQNGTPEQSSGGNPLAFAQWSHSKMGQNTVKAWHFHHRQVDWWYVPIGVIHTALIDNREESPTFAKKLEFKMGDPDLDPEALTIVVRIPQGVLHGCRVLTETAHLFYMTSEVYNPNDEGRIPFNHEDIDHNWGEENSLVVAANDRKLFIPPHPRLVSVENL